jgi:hypothetical protein
LPFYLFCGARYKHKDKTAARITGGNYGENYANDDGRRYIVHSDELLSAF